MASRDLTDYLSTLPVHGINSNTFLPISVSFTSSVNCLRQAMLVTGSFADLITSDLSDYVPNSWREITNSNQYILNTVSRNYLRSR